MVRLLYTLILVSCRARDKYTYASGKLEPVLYSNFPDPLGPDTVRLAVVPLVKASPQLVDAICALSQDIQEAMPAGGTTICCAVLYCIINDWRQQLMVWQGSMSRMLMLQHNAKHAEFSHTHASNVLSREFECANGLQGLEVSTCCSIAQHTCPC